MLNITNSRGPVWPNSLMPRGAGSFEQEDFASWWKRNKIHLAHLHQEICEQWVYRHWDSSAFKWLSLQDLKWSRATWDVDKILSEVTFSFSETFNANYDYEQISGKMYQSRTQTSQAFEQGTWDFPIVLLAAPDGVVLHGELLPEKKYVLVEGHQRFRYLNALHVLKKPVNREHLVYILHCLIPATR
jgi:hypothetical protein